MNVFFSLHQAPAMALSGWGWVLVFLLVVAVLALILWWATQYTPQDAYTPRGGHGEAHEAHAPAEAASRSAAVEIPSEPDDLKKIEGIGPKTERILNEHGITTFAQLAEASVETLQAILDEAGFRLGDPGTWAEQAALAAKGEWETLETLQEQLKGGRRV